MFDRRVVPVVIVILLAICVRVVLADGPQPGGKTEPPGEAGEPVQADEVQEVDPVEPASGQAGLALLGRMHPALVHFPIAWVFLLVLLEIAALLTRRDDLYRAGLPLIALACLSFVPAAATGFLRVASMGNDPEFRALMVPHRNMNIAAGLACLAALVIRVRLGRSLVGSKARWPYLLLVGCAGVLLLVAGHLGGKLVFGRGYLPF